METRLFMGCDIAQDTFTFCLRDQHKIICQGEIDNTRKAIRELLSQLKRTQKINLEEIIFCMEHTGVYGMILMRTLYQRSLVVCVEGAAHIKLSLGLKRGKNDRIDAQRIAEYAMRYTDRLKQWKPKRDVLEKLQLLSSLRSRLIKARTVLSSHTTEVRRFMGKAEGDLLNRGSKDSLNALQADIKKVDQEIEEIISGDENLCRLSKLITSIDGVGMVTCAAVLVKTNEFIDIAEAKKFSCTAGIAPFEHVSGKSIRGKSRVSHRAHKDLKTLLHMCAVGSISRKGELRDFYLRKLGEG